MAAKQLMTENIVKAANVIRNAEAIIVTAGAGIGVDSGLPDFRFVNEKFLTLHGASVMNRAVTA